MASRNDAPGRLRTTEGMLTQLPNAAAAYPRYLAAIAHDGKLFALLPDAEFLVRRLSEKDVNLLAATGCIGHNPLYNLP